MKTNTARKKFLCNTGHFRREIQWDQSQLAIYTTGKLDILDPTGEPIDVIGTQTKQLDDMRGQTKSEWSFNLQ